MTAALQLADLRIFTEPQQGASYDDLLAVALRLPLPPALRARVCLPAVAPRLPLPLARARSFSPA